ncbi:DUF2326 domain-containing protein [Mycoplasma sp. Ms02]|nr:DUF2326 domain-containing protein [Mycoplasma sp. Ms02]
MIKDQITILKEQLPELIDTKDILLKDLENLQTQRQELHKKYKHIDNPKQFEKAIQEIKLLYLFKGEWTQKLKQINEIEQEVSAQKFELNEIFEKQKSKESLAELDLRLEVLNDYFSKASRALYGENFYLVYNINEKNKKIDFYTSNTTSSSGKKQGEIICFDLAYILYCKNMKLKTLNFLVNDKKELMDNNQLLLLNDYLSNKDIQVVLSILESKIPQKLKNDNTVLELSQNSKLFKV